MDIIIIEDEPITAEDLQDIITHLYPEAVVRTILSSVREAIAYFRNNPMPQLIFSDIQLGDGLSFEIFEAVYIPVPIIFCTAYDAYALNAFKTNGIHYILKPFDETLIREAVEKFQKLRSSFSVDKDALTRLLSSLRQPVPESQGSLLVHQADKIIPVKIKDIALFYIKNEVCHLFTFDHKTFYINKSLDEVQQLCGPDFYRANRQYIVNRNAVKEVSQTLARKVTVGLNVSFPESILVSKEKMTDFYEWLKNSPDIRAGAG